MTNRVTVRPPAALERIERRGRRLVANAINRTLEEAQRAAQEALPRHLTIRSGTSRSHLERLIKFERQDRATPEQLVGRMGLQDSGSGARRRSAKLLIRLASGGTFTRGADQAPFAIPTTGPGGARPTPTSIIPRRLYPTSLGLTESRRIEGGHTIRGLTAFRKRQGFSVQLRGKYRTFAIDPRFHPNVANPETYGVYQRRDRGREAETFLLFAYRRQIRLPQKYPFQEIAGTAARERLAINLQGFLDSVRRRAR